MKKVEDLLLAILKSLIGLALILIGLLFGRDLLLVSVPLVVCGLLICIFVYLNIAEKIEIARKAEESNQNQHDE